MKENNKNFMENNMRRKKVKKKKKIKLSKSCYVKKQHYICGGMTHSEIKTVGLGPPINLYVALGIAQNERSQEKFGMVDDEDERL